MKKSHKIILCSIFTGFQLFQPVSSYANPSSIDDKPMRHLASMLSKTTPSVVNIAVEKIIPQTPDSWRPEADQNSGLTKVLGVGSGVIIDAKKGYIVTNAHVIKNQKIVMVTIKDDDRRYRAKIIGKDDGFDLAVIQIHAQHLIRLPIGNSDQLKVGNFVVAIGSPFGLTQTVTSGIISALNRQEPRINNFQSFIQTDAAINPGNSGGALMDLKGELIGINTAIIVTPSSSNIGIGFAIPSNIVKSVAKQLIKYGQVKHGMLGVTTQSITPELADAMKIKYNNGALVTEVISKSPAAKAGVEVQDIIESANGIRIHSSAQLHNMLGLVRPGTKIQLIVLRDHRIFKIETKVTDTKELLLQQGLPFLCGMRMQKFNDLEPNGTILKGVLVTSVDDSSDGALAGLEPGDIIIGANDYSAPTISDLIKVARSRPKELFLKVMRNSGQLFLVIPQSNS